MNEHLLGKSEEVCWILANQRKQRNIECFYPSVSADTHFSKNNKTMHLLSAVSLPWIKKLLSYIVDLRFKTSGATCNSCRQAKADNIVYK